jgi:hypothetical protein
LELEKEEGGREGRGKREGEEEEEEEEETRVSCRWAP